MPYPTQYMLYPDILILPSRTRDLVSYPSRLLLPLARWLSETPSFILWHSAISARLQTAAVVVFILNLVLFVGLNGGLHPSTSLLASIYPTFFIYPIYWSISSRCSSSSPSSDDSLTIWPFTSILVVVGRSTPTATASLLREQQLCLICLGDVASMWPVRLSFVPNARPLQPSAYHLGS